MSNGHVWVWIGCIIAYLGSRLGSLLSPILEVILIVLGGGILLYGCFLWARWKHRHWAFMFWGILAPIGLLGISLLKDKTIKLPEEPNASS